MEETLSFFEQRTKGRDEQDEQQVSPTNKLEHSQSNSPLNPKNVSIYVYIFCCFVPNFFTIIIFSQLQ